MTEQNLIQLSADILRKLRNDRLTASQYRLIFYLLELTQSGEWVDLHSTTLAAELNINPKTASRALNRLEEIGIFELELLSAQWQVKLKTDGQKCPDDGQKCPDDGQKCPDDGQKCPDDGQKCPDDGQKCPDDGQKCPSTLRQNERSRRFPQNPAPEAIERSLSNDLKDQKISLLPGETVSEILKFILERNPHAETPAYARTAWKNDREFWLTQYREFKAGGLARQETELTRHEYIKNQCVALLKQAQDDPVSVGALVEQFQRDFPALLAELQFEQPELFHER